MGISNTTLGKIERGSIPITPEMRAAVAAAYDWPEDWVENRPVLNPPGDLENRVARLERDLAAVRDMVAAHLRLLEREVDQARRDRAEDP